MKKLTILTIIAGLLISVNGWCTDMGSYSVSLASVNSSKMLVKTNSTKTFSRQVIADGYFDSRTGHRYFRNESGSYDEFNKKGEYFKTVPADLPLLVKSLNIHPIISDSYIIYQRKVDGLNLQMVLSADQEHPKNWKAVTVLAGK